MTEHPLPSGIAIRPARPGDAETLTHLHLDVWDDAYTGLLAQAVLDQRRERVDERVARWREILTGPHRNLLAEGPDGLVGFAAAGPGRDADLDPGLELQALYVRARLWGRGVGHALLRASIGDRGAYLWVLHGNERAIGFYERHGFHLDGTQDQHDDGLHLRMVRADRTDPDPAPGRATRP